MMSPIYMILRASILVKHVFKVVVTNHPDFKEGDTINIEDISTAFNADPFNIVIIT